MRLHTLDIRGFGQLRGIVDLETGAGTVALLLERNEAGKSTLAAAITAALYGLESDRRGHRGRKTPLDRYRPWSGGMYGLELLLERDGRELRIARDFTEGTVQVYDGSRDVTAEFRRGKEVEVGEILTGLTRAQFELSAFVPQGQIVWDDPSTMAEALQRAADSQSGERTAAAAIDILQGALDQYAGLKLGKGKVQTEINRCHGEAVDAQRELDLLEERRAGLDAQVEELRQLESEEGETRIRREALRLRRAATELGFELEARAENDKRRARRDELLARLKEDPALEGITDDIRRELGSERRRHGILAGKLEDLSAQLRDAERRRDEGREQLRLTPLVGTPTADQVSDIGALLRTRDEKRDSKMHLVTALETEQEQVREAGFDPATAARLADRFGGLTDRDRALLGGLRKRRLELEDEHERARERLHSAKEEIASIRDQQDRRRRRGLMILAVGASIAAAGCIGAYFSGLALWLGAIPGAAVLVAGLYLAISSSSYRSSAEGAARARLEEMEAELQRLDESQSAMNAELETLAGRLGCSAEELEESWRSWLDLQPHTAGLAVYEGRVAAIESDEERLAEQLQELEPLLGRTPEPSELDDLYAQAREARGIADQVTALESQRTGLERRVEEQRAQIQESEASLRRQLEEFGADTGAGLERAFEDFEQRATRASELQHVRASQLPQLERIVATPEQQIRRAQHIEELERQISAGRPTIERELAKLGSTGLAILGSLDAPLNEDQLQEELRSLEADIERRHDASTRQLTDVRSFVERYEREAPALRERIAELREAGQRASAFTAAIELARDTLDGLAQQTHQIWSRELAQHTNATLAAMGSDIGEVQFDEELNLSLVQRGQRMSGAEARQALSTGARDLLHLACRIALARFLSGGDLDLPLVLDDPFAHCDDPRTLAGMKVLVEAIAPEHQVILLACQRSRYQWVTAQIEYPERIRTLELEDRG
jgi:DNA repair exonuclease SbcCD ATPase subunit